MKCDNLIIKICPERPSLKTITNTERLMNVTFSEDYKQFTLEYGFIALSSPFINFYEWQFFGALNSSEYDMMNIRIFNDYFRKKHKNPLMNNDEYIVAVNNMTHNGFVPYISNAKGEIFRLDANGKLFVERNIGTFYNKICNILSQKYNKVTHTTSKYYSWDERHLFLDTIIVRPRKSVNNIPSLTDRDNVRSTIAKSAIAYSNFDSYENDRIRFYYDDTNKFDCISIAYPTFVILKPNDLLLDRNFNKLIKQLKSLDKDFINQNDGRRNIYYFKKLNIQVVNVNNSENYSSIQVYVA